MLCDSVPGHHVFNHLQSLRKSISFRFIPKLLVRPDSPPALEAILKSVGRSPSSQLNSLAPSRASGISGIEQEEIPNFKTVFGANLEREQEQR